jgi:hypothetical protein
MANETSRQFERLYREYLTRHEAAAWIGEAIDRAVESLESRHRARWDARHFLLVNMHQMVVLPQEQSQPPVEDLQRIVGQDLKSILAKAAEYGREISSHAVLEATSEIYGQLECSGLWTARWW